MIAAVEGYLAVRRLGGFALSNNEYLLRSFVAYASAQGEAVVRTATVVAWASLGPSLAQRHRRYETVRQFATQVHLDDPRHDVPSARYFGYRKTRRPPRLYTATEIDQLLAVAAQLPSPDTLTPHTYGALIRLLAATGLRISEALALQIGDLSSDGLLIRTTKFQKTRLVPLHENARRGLEQYLHHPARPPSRGPWVFVSDRGLPLRYHDVHPVFRRLVIQARLPRDGGRAPTLHGLRHTFAVRALAASPTGRRQVGQAMRALATYLGHGSIASTYWYLEATPELLAEVAVVSERLLSGELA
ncbi:MAG TPA: tyrosine-type recombinase/integrase [Egibacteraceae bacterium]|nr:tyrosine-type recombinase/integrase [Egibacteraceae bacterium]